MKERPILFSAPMVRAILGGRKTQTRRALRVQPTTTLHTFMHHVKGPKWCTGMPTVDLCPYDRPGNKLWVRETWWEFPEPSLRQLREGADTWPKPTGPRNQRVDCAADDVDRDGLRSWGWKLRPSIFMPRLALRITLEIADVRVRRLQNISEEDAIAEGAEPWAYGPEQPLTSGESGATSPYRGNFACLWGEIDADRATWYSNPWVWTVSFKTAPASRERPGIS